MKKSAIAILLSLFVMSCGSSDSENHHDHDGHEHHNHDGHAHNSKNDDDHHPKDSIQESFRIERAEPVKH